MRRLFAFAVVVNLAALAFLPTGSATAALSCSNPTKLTGYHDGIAFPGGYRVNQDVWTEQGSQTMYVCSPRSWKAIVNQSGAPATGVKAYPASERTYTDWATCVSQPRLDSFTKLSSSYGHVAPTSGAWDFSYDLFIGSGACSRPLTEVMIFTQVRNVDLPAAQFHPTIDGVAYDVYHAPFTAALLGARVYHRPAATISPALTGGEYIQMRQRTQTTSGTVNFRRVFKWLSNHALLVMSDTMEFLRYGVEPLTTRGKDVTFEVNDFSVTDAH